MSSSSSVSSLLLAVESSGLLAVVCALSCVVIALFVSLVLVYLSTDPYPNVSRTAAEQTFYDPVSRTHSQFPSVRDAATVDLSVIVPAYNEEERLALMMDDLMEYLEREALESRLTYEVIVVDDGSRDRTSEKALGYSRKYGTEKVRVLTLGKNRGKGGAVRHGVRSCRGREVLFADADGATDVRGLADLQQSLGGLVARSDCRLGLVCGSRALLGGDSSAVKRSPVRSVLMHAFRLWVAVLCAPRVVDTQCGFKLFSRPAARLLFGNLHVDRWAFDVELLYLARHFRVPVAEVPVSWTERDGSKLVPVFSWLQMARDILLIRIRYAIGAWKIEPSHRLLE